MPCFVNCISCKPQWKHHCHQHALDDHACHPLGQSQGFGCQWYFCGCMLSFHSHAVMTTMFASTHTGSICNMSHLMPCDVQWLEGSCMFVMLLFKTWWWAKCDLPHVVGCMWCYLAFMSFWKSHIRHILCHFSIVQCSICVHQDKIMKNSSKHVSM